MTAKAGNVCFCSPFNNADFKAGPALQSSYETSCAERSYLQLLREDEQHKVSANQLPYLLLGPRNPKSLREQEVGESCQGALGKLPCSCSTWTLPHVQLCHKEHRVALGNSWYTLEKEKQTLEGHSHLRHNHLLFSDPAPHKGQWEMALPSLRNIQGEK